jgi:hypothetical protein
MSLSRQIGPEFLAFDFTHERRTYEVFRVACLRTGVHADPPASWSPACSRWSLP